MNYFVIKTPKTEYDSYIWWITETESASWMAFFTQPGSNGNLVYNRSPLDDAKRAYQAIGYKCVKLRVEEIE